MKKVLYISRFNNDFERFLALADKFSGQFDQTLFHIYPLDRLTNSYLFNCIDSSNVILLSITDFSVGHKVFAVVNHLARLLKSKILWRLGQYFLSMGSQNPEKIATGIINKLKPDLVFFTYTEVDAPLPIYLALHKISQLRSIPIMMLCTGVAAYASLPNLKEQIKEKAFITGDYLFAASDFEFKNFYLPELSMSGPFRKKLAFGDPRLAKPFIEKLIKHFKSSQLNKLLAPKNDQGLAVAIFGNNVSFMSGGKQEHQDEVIYRIVCWLKRQGVQKILVRFHPQTAFTKIREQILKAPGVEDCNQINVTQVLACATHVVTPPSTVLFEAMILQKPILIVDDLPEVLFSFTKFGIKKTSSLDLLKLNLDEALNNYDMKLIHEFVWARQENGENRGLFLDFVKQIVET